MGKRGRKLRKMQRSHRMNIHHILFEKKVWSYGYLLLLRRVFAYEMPVSVHRRLHENASPVAPLSESEAMELWHRYDGLGHKLSLFEALGWLIRNAPNEQFARAIEQQERFLLENL